MQKMASVIQNHSTDLLKDTVAPIPKKCSSRQKFNCPLVEKCVSECLVYYAQVDRPDINQTKLLWYLRTKFQKVLQQP